MRRGLRGGGTTHLINETHKGRYEIFIEIITFNYSFPIAAAAAVDIITNSVNNLRCGKYSPVTRIQIKMETQLQQFPQYLRRHVLRTARRQIIQSLRGQLANLNVRLVEFILEQMLDQQLRVFAEVADEHA